MSYILFYTLLSTRLVAPPIIFYYLHPFYAMIIDECVVDGLLAPHHLLINLIPKEMNINRKPHYDLPLDAWGFLNGLQPIMCKKHKYNHVFKGYEVFLITLFFWRMIGIALLYVTKNLKVLAVFANFYIGAYLAIAGCSLYKVTNKRTINIIIIVSMLLAYTREIFLIKLNIVLKTAL
jgi:hypothetical protein